MSRVEQLYAQINELNLVEREELLVTLSEKVYPFHPLVYTWPHPLFAQDQPSIVSTPGVCGGAPRLIRTRIPIWVLERMRQLGVSESDILRSYPTLRAADLVQAWSYAARNQKEIEKAIRENEEE